MKKIILPLAILFTIAACNTTDKKAGDKTNAPKTQTDSLLKEIDDGHILGMSKIGKLHITKQQVQGVIDSIGKLPAKVQQAAAPYLEQLKNAIKDLDYADMAMEKWMMEYDEDSAKEKVNERIDYLLNEKLKVSKMKEAILNSLHKGDSLLKAKF